MPRLWVSAPKRWINMFRLVTAAPITKNWGVLATRKCFSAFGTLQSTWQRKQSKQRKKILGKAAGCSGPAEKSACQIVAHPTSKNHHRPGFTRLLSALGLTLQTGRKYPICCRRRPILPDWMDRPRPYRLFGSLTVTSAVKNSGDGWLM